MLLYHRQALSLVDNKEKLGLMDSSPTVSIITVTTTVYMYPTGYCPECLGSAIRGPDAKCTGYYIESYCVPRQVWMAMYNYWWSTDPNPPEPSIEAVPGVRIQGPRLQCEGYRINTRCFDKDELWKMAAKLDKLTSVSTVISTNMATDMSLPSVSLTALPVTSGDNGQSTSSDTPTSDPTPGAHKTNPKLGLIAIPFILIVFALIGGYWFWCRRKFKKATVPPPVPERPAYTLGDLYAGRVPDAELNKLATIESDDEQASATWDPTTTFANSDAAMHRRRYSRKGVKFFNEKHERKELEKERAERQSATESVSTEKMMEAILASPLER